MNTPRVRIVSAFLAAMLLAGCTCTKKPKSAPVAGPSAGSPALTLNASGAQNKRVGDRAEILWSSDQPVEWELVRAPLGWRVLEQTDTQIKIGGTYEMGASERTETCEVRAESQATPTQSTGTSEHRAMVRVVDPASFTLVRQEGVTKHYTLNVRSDTPPWSDPQRGKVSLDVDTRGLSNPGSGAVPDKIHVSDDDDRATRKENTATGPCTEGGTVETEERFTLVGGPWQAAFADGQIDIVLVNQWAPPAGRCEEDALVRVKVTFH